MKCSKCGYRAKDIAHMAAHYRKAHPKAMAKKKRKPSKFGFETWSKARLIAELKKG